VRVKCRVDVCLNIGISACFILPHLYFNYICTSGLPLSPAFCPVTSRQFYPSEQVPVLVYFKETQTKPEGQIHFFPVIGNPARLLENFRKYVPLPGK